MEVVVIMSLGRGSTAVDGIEAKKNVWLWVKTEWVPFWRFFWMITLPYFKKNRDHLGEKPGKAEASVLTFGQ